MLLTSCFDCHELFVKKRRSEETCFIRHFPKKKKSDFLKKDPILWKMYC